MPISQACIVGVQNGRARCRNEQGKCPVHARPAFWQKAPRPDVVLVKVNANQHWEERLRRMGISEKQRSFEKAEELEEQRVQRAASLGRDAYSARDDRDAAHKTPESADSGCPVFLKGGLKDLRVSIIQLEKELHDAGFMLTNAHLLGRLHKPPVRLVMEFSRIDSGKERMLLPWRMLDGFLGVPFNQVDVWANDPDPLRNNQVVHTVNCGKRQNDAKPGCFLHFAGGDWDAEEVPQPVAA